MAYTDPTTGVTRDKYGNEVVRDPTGTATPANNYLAWAVGLVIAAALAFAVINMSATDQSSIRTSAPDSTVTQPVAPKTDPQTP